MVLSELLESVPAGGSEAFVQFWPESPAVRGDLSSSFPVGQLLVLRPVCGWPMQYATNVREQIGQLDSFYIVRQQAMRSACSCLRSARGMSENYSGSVRPSTSRAVSSPNNSLTCCMLTSVSSTMSCSQAAGITSLLPTCTILQNQWCSLRVTASSVRICGIVHNRLGFCALQRCPGGNMQYHAYDVRATDDRPAGPQQAQTVPPDPGRAG